MKINDVLGNEVTTLINEEKPEEVYEVEFSAIGGSLSAGKHGTSGGNAYKLPSGYQLRAGDPWTCLGQCFVETKKMILLK